MRIHRNLPVILVLICGVIVLAYNLGVLSVRLENLWPIIPLLWGIHQFYQFFMTRNKDLLIFATMLTGGGILFLTQILLPGFKWPESTPWWPLFPLLWGIGAFLTYLADPKDKRFLLTFAVLAAGSVLLFISNVHDVQYLLKYWPLLLIAVCVIILAYNAKKPAPANIKK